MDFTKSKVWASCTQSNFLSEANVNVTENLVEYCEVNGFPKHKNSPPKLRQQEETTELKNNMANSITSVW